MDASMNADSEARVKETAATRDVSGLAGHPFAVRGTQEVRGRGLVLEWRQSAGTAAILLGMIGILLGWWGISGENNVYRQLPYVISGGIGGASLIALGVTLLVSYEHSTDREVIGARLDDLADRLGAIESSIDELRAGGSQAKAEQRQAAVSSPGRRRASSAARASR